MNEPRPKRRERRPVARHRAMRATHGDHLVLVVSDCLWWLTVLDADPTLEEVRCPRCDARVPVARYDL